MNTIIQKIDALLGAIANCERVGNTEWREKHEAALARIEAHLPSGSGFDCGTKIVRDKHASNPDRVVFHTSFHHMSEAGFYTGWTEHDVIVTATFSGLHIRVTGRNEDEIKDYIAEVFDSHLTETYKPEE